MIASTVLHKLSPVLHLMDHAADTAQEAVEDTRKAVDHLYRTSKETRDELQKGLEAAKDDLIRTTEDIKDGINKLAEVATATANNANGMPTRHPEPCTYHPSYAEALSCHLPMTHLSTLARTWVKEKQVLIDKNPTANSDPIQGLTECELVTKANEALTAMTA